MSETPRTDAAFYNIYKMPSHATEILKAEMSKLERELNEAKAKLVAAENIHADQISEIEMSLHGGMPDDDQVIDGTDTASHIWRLRRERDRWRECAQRLKRQLLMWINPDESIDTKRDREAIQHFDELEKGGQ